MPTVWKSGSLNLVEPSDSAQVHTGSVLPLLQLLQLPILLPFKFSIGEAQAINFRIAGHMEKKCRNEVITCKHAMIISLIVNRLSLRLRRTLGQNVKFSQQNDLSVKLLSLAHLTSTHLTTLFKSPSVLISPAYDCLLQILNHN